MNIYFFDVRISDTVTSIKPLIEAFGDNIPQPMLYEGGAGLTYLFCLNKTIDEIISICNTHNCEILGMEENTPMWRRHAFTEQTIDPAKYNSLHSAGISYKKGEHYVLDIKMS
jgi:hypothetical protein